MKQRKTVGGYKLLIGYLGIFLIFIGIICYLPIIGCLFFKEEVKYLHNFAYPGCFSIVLGFLFFHPIIGKDKASLGKHQDALLLVLIWISAILIGSMPFKLSGMTFTEAVFESASGYSTIGLTRFFTEANIASGVSSIKLLIIYRTVLLFFGGIGLVLVVTSAISDRYALKLYTAEGHNDKLLPNLKNSARLILSIYAGYILIGTILYKFVGKMDWFDSFNHSVAALATGGFSSRAGGILDCGGNQLAIEIISCVLMLLGGTNFLIHMFLLSGKFKKAFKDIELRFFGLISVILVPLFFVSVLCSNNGYTPLQSLRYGTFTYISAITTTGFSNVADITKLGQGVLLLIVLVNIIGGATGSTAGGVKQYRFAVMFKSFFWGVRYRHGSSKKIYPYLIYKSGETKELTTSEAIESFSYALLYILTLLIGAFGITLCSKGTWSYGDCLFEFSNALSSTGLTNGISAAANNGTMWILIVGMIAGRLEIYAIYFAIYRVFRDILRKETI